jgi:hypothetical protein
MEVLWLGFACFAGKYGPSNSQPTSFVGVFKRISNGYLSVARVSLVEDNGMDNYKWVSTCNPKSH